MTRREACYYLGIREDAAEEQIKRAYRYKAKLYHPDVNPDRNTQEYYIKVQEAYEYLMNNLNTTYGTPPPTGYSGANPAGAYYSNANSFGAQAASARPARVYASTATAKASYKRQKEKEKERERIQKWDEEYKSSKRRQQQTQLYGQEYTDRMTGTSKSKEDEILEKIRAIWIAETIRRQIELDKEHKEVLQRRKLYQAFMQQQMDDDSAKRISKSAKDTD